MVTFLRIPPPSTDIQAGTRDSLLSRRRLLMLLSTPSFSLLLLLYRFSVFIYLSVGRAAQRGRRKMGRSRFSPSIVPVPGIKLSSSGLTVGAFPCGDITRVLVLPHRGLPNVLLCHFLHVSLISSSHGLINSMLPPTIFPSS